MFTVHREVALALGVFDDILIVTPGEDIEVHLDLIISTIFEADLELYEAPTATPGTPLVAYNRKRASAIEPVMTLTHTPTGVTPGSVLLDTMQVGAGRTGGINRGSEEWNLMPDTKYLLRSTSRANGNIVITSVIWYEVKEDEDDG
jgi:hypothetical protein